MSILLNLELQSNCLSLDWAPAQLQLVKNCAQFSFCLIKPRRICFQVFGSSLEMTSPDAFNLYGFMEVLKAILSPWNNNESRLTFTSSLMCSQVCWDRASGRNCWVGLLSWPPVPARRVHDLEGAGPSTPPPPRWSQAPPLHQFIQA